MRRALLSMAGVAVAVAVAVDPSAARSAAERTWPPFVLVSGLLLVGQVAHADGVFDWAGDAVGRLRVSPVVLLLVLLGLAASVTTVLNLDTSVTFLTPVLVIAGRRRGVDERPFLLGSLLMANAASLLLPGSNLTNLLVLSREQVAGATFAAAMLPAWVAAVVTTAVVVVARFRRVLSSRTEHASDGAPGGHASRPRVVGVVATVVAGALVVALPSPALPVLALGIVVAAAAVARRALRATDAVRELDVVTLAALYALAVALGTVADGWSAPAHVMRTAGRAESTAVGALAAVLVNNLPAAVLLGSHTPAHPRALLIGLDVGPNLAVTGSLSALLWYRAAARVGSRPSIASVSRLGVVLVPLSIAAALAATVLLAPAHL